MDNKVKILILVVVVAALFFAIRYDVAGLQTFISKKSPFLKKKFEQLGWNKKKAGPTGGPTYQDLKFENELKVNKAFQDKVTAVLNTAESETKKQLAANGGNYDIDCSSYKFESPGGGSNPFGPAITGNTNTGSEAKLRCDLIRAKMKRVAEAYDPAAFSVAFDSWKRKYGG